MSEYLGPGSIFAGCRLEAIAGRGGMGVVFQATQLALERPVALKAIAPEFATDTQYRERFQRESHLAASIDHPNVIPVYEAGESGGTLYLIMRWVEGTDLRTLLTSSGRMSPGRAIRLLRPVASALAAAHRRGLVHRDVKPANVLITRGEEEDEDHIYLTDFGIARQTGGKSLTRTGLFVGTIDYAAPERISGARGDAPADIYSFGCMLFEAVTGHAPFDRPSDVSKMFAHLNDPIPSVRQEVDGVPDQLDRLITQAMAKRPEDRLASASELTGALGRVLQELDTAEREAAAPQDRADVTKIRASQIVAEPAALTEPGEPAAALTEPGGPAAALTETSAPATEPASAVTEPTEPIAEPAAASTEPSGSVTEPAGTATEMSALAPDPTAPSRPPTIPSRPPTIPSELPKRARRRPRRSLALWGVLIAVLAAAGVLAVVLTGGSHAGNAGAASTPAASAAPTKVVISGAGLARGRTVNLSSPPGGISANAQGVWVSLPDRGEVVQIDPSTGTQRILTTGGIPTAIAAGPSALWVAGTASNSLAEFNGGTQVAVPRLGGAPSAITVDPHDSSAWVADSSGAISHVAPGGTVIGTPAQANPLATSIAFGEGWVWATNGAPNGLIRVSKDTSGSSTAFSVTADPVAVTLDQGVWTAHANGHVTRFDPRPKKLAVNANIATHASELDAIAATDGGPYVWAISKSAKTLYRIKSLGLPALTGTVVFGSPPVALAVSGSSVWVATQDGRITEIRS
jgi:serine/threonine protein kinase